MVCRTPPTRPPGGGQERTVSPAPRAQRPGPQQPWHRLAAAEPRPQNEDMVAWGRQAQAHLTRRSQPLPRAAVARRPPASEHRLLRGLETAQPLLRPDPTEYRHRAGRRPLWPRIVAAAQEPVQRLCPVNPAKFADSWHGVPGATTGRLCPGSRTQQSRSHPLPEPGGLVSPGSPQPECWVPACSPQWAQPAKSGLKKGFCGYKQTNKPALRTKGWHFFPIKSQKINTSVSVGHTASVVAGQLCRGRTAAADTHGRGRPFPSKAGLSRTGRGQCADPALEEWASSGTQAQPERRSLPCLPCGADRKHTRSAKEARAARDRGRQVGTLPSSVTPRGPPVQELRRQARVTPAAGSRSLCIGHLLGGAGAAGTAHAFQSLSTKSSTPSRQAPARPRCGPGRRAPTFPHKRGQRCCCVFDYRTPVIRNRPPQPGLRVPQWAPRSSLTLWIWGEQAGSPSTWGEPETRLHTQSPSQCGSLPPSAPQGYALERWSGLAGEGRRARQGPGG